MSRKAAGRKGASKQPITSHPLFPAIVALWFGALFGLGSLAIRPALLESLVLKAHLDLVFPAAAPPLGITARLLLSLALALTGGVIGALIARRITRPKPAARERSQPGNGIFGRASRPQPQRSTHVGGLNRPLAIDQEYDPVYHHEFAPLPGGDAPQILPQILDVTGFDFDAEPIAAENTPPDTPQDITPQDMWADTGADAGDDAPAAGTELDLSGFLAGDAPLHHPDGPEEPAVMTEQFNPFAAPQPVQSFAAPTPPEAQAPVFQAPLAAAVPVAPQPQPQPQQPFTAPAFAQPIYEQPAELFAAPQPVAAAPFAPAPALAPAPAAALVEPAEPANLGALSHSDLIARLSQSLKQRREAAALANAAAITAPPLFADRMTAPMQPEPVQTDSVANFMAMPPAAFATPAPPMAQFAAPATEAAPFGQPALTQPALTMPPAEIAASSPPMPAAMRPLSFDEPEPEDDFSAHLPPRHIAMPTAYAAPAEPETETVDGDNEALAEGYSSLLDLSRPAQPPLQAQNLASFVRIEEAVAEDGPDAIEPVVIFPGQAAQAPVQSHAPFGAPAAAPAPFAQPVAAEPTPFGTAEPEIGGALRRFDAPASGVAHSQPASTAPLPQQDREETERALRTALSSLQRMSATG